MPVIGGLLADRYLGMRKAVVLGGVLLCLGHFGMAVEGTPAHMVERRVVRDEGALQVFYLSLALIIMGVGFLKPNISTIVGKLYPDNDPRRDSGFTIFYAGINLGALFASAGLRLARRDLRLGATASAPRASAWSPGSASSSGARSTCAATPSRRDPARSARARGRPAARMVDLSPACSAWPWRWCGDRCRPRSRSMGR